MRCYVCHGVDTYEDRVTRFCACDAPEPFIVENVPAKVCSQCGEKAYSAEANTALEKVSNGYAKPTNGWFIPVFDFNDLDNVKGARGSVYMSFSNAGGEPTLMFMEPLQKWGPVSSGLPTANDLKAVIGNYLAGNQYRKDFSSVGFSPYVCPASEHVAQESLGASQKAYRPQITPGMFALKP